MKAIFVSPVAAFGGIVGLCMGFSILSGFELIYFFTIRLLVDRTREAKKLNKIRNENDFYGAKG